ncbi:MAG: xanthine dehydrogenase accessory protein XdhC [Ponticaulis sp.]|nr:xanthine dehydrogenase accessory protein XdhC [Ponticaulis sp.]
MNRLDWTEIALSQIVRHGATVLITQSVVEGSAPREAGAKMLVSDDTVIGTIGGGNLEFQAIRQARELLSRPDLKHLVQDYPLGPFLKQCCGGHVRLLLERLTGDDTDWLTELIAQKTRPGRLLLETRLDGKPPRKALRSGHEFADIGAGCFLDKDGSVLSNARPDRNTCAAHIEPLRAIPLTVMLYGAGHVGAAIAHVLSISDFPLRQFDSRKEFQARHIEPLSEPESIISHAPSSAIHLILTHDHDLDYQLTRAILTRNDFVFCGLIGSKTKRARFIRRLKTDGVPEAAISRLVCPIGLPEISGKAPHVIATSVAGQLYQLVSETELQASASRTEALRA